MPWQENKKEYNRKYDSENMAYQTVKVRKELLEQFRAAVAANGDKVNSVLRNAMEEYIKEHSAGADHGEPEPEQVE